MTNFPKATIVGYPRIGRGRELKFAEESFWSGKSSLEDLKNSAKELRLSTYERLAGLGLVEDFSIPNSFSYYDQMLDAAVTFGAIPNRFLNLQRLSGVVDESRELNSFGERMRRPIGVDTIDLEAYFTIARGDKSKGEDGLPAEMTKWFDTNYHYLVPELGDHTNLSLSNFEIVRQFTEALEAGYKVRPTIPGPITFLALAKYEDGTTYKDFVRDLTAAYSRLLGALSKAGAKWVQFDEPALVSESHLLNASQMREIADYAYSEFAKLSASGESADRSNILVTTPFGGVLDELWDLLPNLPVEAVHFDAVRGEFSGKETHSFAGKTVVVGAVNGRNVWRGNLEQSSAVVKMVQQKVNADAISVGTSCSLQHVPHTCSAQLEPRLNAEHPALVSNLSFADEKVAEVVAISQLAQSGTVGTRDAALPLDRQNQEVQRRFTAVTDADMNRESIDERKVAQQARLNLPVLPTTTIGSFPQTPQIRGARGQFTRGEITAEQYEDAMKAEIKQCIELQEEIGIDVLVHGEAERNDMVQYFAENFDGFEVTQNGWVQSYGSRCTRPSLLWGDVSRKNTGVSGEPGTTGSPFTTPWISYAQSLTDKPMKGMLTGPVTILAWSFVRDDQLLGETAVQVALALRDEITDLEAAGISIIQVDEPALRELLPLKKSDQPAYLKWSVGSFKLATSGVRVDTQIHTHLCYSEFEVVLPAIIALNADVTSIESARSKGEIVEQIADAKYPLGIGPGVYDIHSPRIPSTEEIEQLLRNAVSAFENANLPITDLWVNPDCGLKTRKDEESTPSLKNMVDATLIVRGGLR